MSKKLFLSSLAMAVALPAMVVPMQAQEVSAEVLQELKDVSKGNSAYKEIMAMYDQGIIDAYPGNLFKPAQSISRVHVASSFVQALDLTPVRAGKEFKDVPKTHPDYDIVQKVYRAGIFDGKDDGNFGIADNLTRAQMAKVIVEAFNLDIHKGYIFDDVSESHWAKDYISSLYMSGITTGSNGKYLPSDSVSRAHYAMFLYRALNPENAPKPDKPLTQTPPVKPEPKPKPKPKPDKDCVEGLYGPGINSCIPEPNTTRPSYVPSGAKLIKDDGYSLVYSYNKGLPGGGAIKEVIADYTRNIVMLGTDNNGKSMMLNYQPERDVIQFTTFGEKPVVNTESLSLLYEIGRDFAKGYGMNEIEIDINIDTENGSRSWIVNTKSKTLGEEIEKVNKSTNIEITLKQTKDGRVIYSFYGMENNDKYEWEITSEDCKGGICSKDVDSIKLDKDMKFVIKYEEK
ncbi:S-layer homology domain-containing protein [Sporosarcina sp. FSL K6-1508]|uniref:S-layer homology domain-containing protein n=1 Tax=Sporosarcina sp. FSL K6-1508 TaxID=2921553 RepID=UPI0030F6BE04